MSEHHKPPVHRRQLCRAWKGASLSGSGVRLLCYLALITASSGFVTVEDGTLRFDGERFLIRGANNYYMMQQAADVSGQRSIVGPVFAQMKDLNLNTLRIWAFGDGDIWNALQPRLLQFDERVFRDGLDWVVWQAGQEGVKLQLVLTSYNAGFGGIRTFTEWHGHDNLLAFYTNPEVRSSFKEYMRTIISRNNSFTGVAYRDDPTILGWDICNEPLMPGDPSGDTIQEWMEEMTAFVKETDPNHLVTIGSHGYWGDGDAESGLLSPPATPSIFNPVLRKLYPDDAVCYGLDFVRNHAIAGMDMTCTHLYVDHWMVGPDPESDKAAKSSFTKRWLQEHWEASQSLGKPLLVGEFGSPRPMHKRIQHFRDVIEFVENKFYSGEGYVAGFMLWMIADSHYPDYDSFTVYPDLAGYQQPNPERDLANIWAGHGEFLAFSNIDGFQRCMFDRAQQRSDWVDGWEDVLNYIRSSAAA